eukprot:CAMPEP_0194213500 /NCGR_PEP_ID=MMETSP0156-20130528/14159_1 /TAXON_ID=33649 /ORGANISM="Thalassionema nitzschioides, Strain L26-B" /LENGTH=285 /DNA_ID=CAMNT_0038941547 /DNA_START=68 /DNA_END=925 /DNA_ORIENTATION=+
MASNPALLQLAFCLQLVMVCLYAAPINVNAQRKIPKTTTENKSSKISIGFSGEYECLLVSAADKDGCTPLFLTRGDRQRKLLPRDLSVGTTYDLSTRYFLQSVFTKCRWPYLISKFECMPFGKIRKSLATIHFEKDPRYALTIQSSLDRRASLLLHVCPHRRLNLSYQWLSSKESSNDDTAKEDLPPKEDWWMPDKLQWQASTGRLESLHQYSWRDCYRFRLLVSTNAITPYPSFEESKTTWLTCQIKYDASSMTSTTATVKAQLENIAESATLSMAQTQTNAST